MNSRWIYPGFASFAAFLARQKATALPVLAENICLPRDPLLSIYPYEFAA
jgi:hypothetical protein